MNVTARLAFCGAARSIDVQPITTTINGAAQALGVGRTTIYDLIRQGRLEKLKLGRRTLVTTASIRNLVERV